ncbi:MAG: hypothetical protein RJA70_510 [Pseudomonadota bacterium]|jgi:hypothetical protein
MASKFADFLAENKIDGRRILSSSKQIERLRPEDRAAILAKRNRKEGAKEEEAPAERRSGRPVTPRLLTAATTGGKLSGPGKTRLLRAINRILEKKKKDAVELRALF